jgi:hypothetical protein
MAHEQYGDYTDQYRQAVIEALESLVSTPEDLSQEAEEADRTSESEVVEQRGNARSRNPLPLIAVPITSNSRGVE